MSVALLPAVPNAAATAADGSETVRAEKPRVKLLSSLWTLQSTRQQMQVRTRYPKAVPPSSYVGKPVEVQVLRSDGTWQTMDTAKQRKVKDERQTTATVEFTFPESGRVLIRARTHPSTGTFTSKQALVLVRTEPVRFNPIALPGSEKACFDASIASLERIVYRCVVFGGRSRAYVINQVTGERSAIGPKGIGDVTLADHAPIVVSSKVIKPRYLQKKRAIRINIRTGKQWPLARKRNGDIVRTSEPLDVSDDGERSLYTSKEPGIVKGAPDSWNVYLKQAGRERSRLIGRRTSTAAISGNGRFVVWRTRNNRIRRTNLRTNRTITIRGARLSGFFAGPAINRSGRYIAYATRLKGKRRPRIRIVDVRTNTIWRAGKGSLPVISPNGKRVGFRSNRREDLIVWTRATKRRTRITVGRNGDGANVFEIWTPEFSADGGHIVAHADSALVAPDNGRDPWDGRNDVVLFDLGYLNEEAR